MNPEGCHDSDRPSTVEDVTHTQVHVINISDCKGEFSFPLMSSVRPSADTSTPDGRHDIKSEVT